MKLSEIISLRILDHEMTDWAFKDTLMDLPLAELKEVIVLPANLRRTKQLLAKYPVRVGTVVDYPLGAGTIAKKAYEVGNSFQNGADFLEMTLNLETLLHHPADLQEIQKTMGSLSLAWGEIRIRVSSEGLKELTKIEIAQRFKEMGWPHVVIEGGDRLETAVHDATILEFDGGKQLTIQVVLQQTTAKDIQVLLASGADKVAVSDLTDLDLSREVHIVKK